MKYTVLDDIDDTQERKAEVAAYASNLSVLSTRGSLRVKETERTGTLLKLRLNSKG